MVVERQVAEEVVVGVAGHIGGVLRQERAGQPTLPLVISFCRIHKKNMIFPQTLHLQIMYASTYLAKRGEGLVHIHTVGSAGSI